MVQGVACRERLAQHLQTAPWHIPVYVPVASVSSTQPGSVACHHPPGLGVGVELLPIITNTSPLASNGRATHARREDSARAVRGPQQSTTPGRGGCAVAGSL